MGLLSTQDEATLKDHLSSITLPVQLVLFTQAFGGSESGDVAKQILNEIASLNDSIKRSFTGGDTPNDLMDRRDLLLDQLSSLAQTSVTANADGTVTVGFGDAGTPLVDGSTVTWPQTLTTPGGRPAASRSFRM